jgi:tetratricopeptide (TPR) repeat protein
VARADRRRQSRTRADAGFERKYESAYVGTEGLFFTRLRTHAKWVFVFLAIAFGLGFVAFGVGSDVQGGLDQLFQGRAADSSPDVGDARERVEENPKNAEAQLALAEALQQDGKPEEAIAPLERYLRLRPKDEEALQLLANLHLTKAQRIQAEVTVAQQEAAFLDPGQTFRPQAGTELGNAIQSTSSFNPAEETTQRVTELYGELQESATAMAATYKRLATISPDDPTVQLQLGEAAQNAGDTETALAAYKKFLKLAPDDPTADVVREQIKALEGAATSSTVGGG